MKDKVSIWDYLFIIIFIILLNITISGFFNEHYPLLPLIISQIIIVGFCVYIGSRDPAKFLKRSLISSLIINISLPIILAITLFIAVKVSCGDNVECGWGLLVIIFLPFVALAYLVLSFAIFCYLNYVKNKAIHLSILILLLIISLLIFIPTYLTAGCLKTDTDCFIEKAWNSKDVNICKNAADTWGCTVLYQRKIEYERLDKESEGILTREDCDFEYQEELKISQMFPDYYGHSYSDQLEKKKDFCYKEVENPST